MPRYITTALMLLLSLLVLLSGCSKQEENPPAPTATTQVKKESRVVIPEAVQGKWKSVKIAVQDKEKNQQEVYTVDIGYGFTLSEANLKLKVENFLPYFQMDGMELTSVSNDPKNPAAQISISEGGREVFRGWLFSRYPNTHAFQHPRYSFSLVDFVPAG